jgi:hypothetical protein
MPIHGLTEKRRLPRLGRIRTGIRETNSKGVEFPKGVDYFVCPPEVQAAHGEKPKLLRILFPVENDAVFASQFYRAYSNSRGLICKGDGETAYRLCDIQNDNFPTLDTKETAMKEVVCDGTACEFYGKKCTEVMNLQFLLPDVPGLGIYQLDTGSINAIINVNSAIELVREIVGHIKMVPLNLVIEPIEVAPDGKKKTVHVINIRIDKTLRELRADLPKLTRRIDKETGEINPGLPVPDDEIPELLVPENQVPPHDQEADDQLTGAPPADIDWSKTKNVDFKTEQDKLMLRLGMSKVLVLEHLRKRGLVNDSGLIIVANRNLVIAELTKMCAVEGK